MTSNDPPDRGNLPAGDNSTSVDRSFLQELIDTVGDPIFVKDEEHRWIFLNDAYCRFMGYSRDELLGKSDYDFFPDEQADIFWEKDDYVFSTGEPHENEEAFTDAEGNEHIIITKKTLFVDSQGRKRLVGVIRDITERRRLENRLAVARRLMSLGTLAGGVAHEINNPLSYVSGNLTYALESLHRSSESTEAIREALEAALRGADRVRDVVEGLRHFSGTAEEDRLEVIDVHHCLRATVRIANNEIRHRARLVENYGEIPSIEGNERALGQIFLNILINAVQSLESKNAAHNEVSVHTYTGQDDQAVIEISDTGCGMSDEVRKHIFDPFYSTKPVGQGTGLGLAISHTLIESMDGTIEVDSQPGRGSTFRLCFPPSTRPEQSPSAEIDRTAPSDNEDRPSRVVETTDRVPILVIDDEAEVLKALRRQLKYWADVTTVTRAREALSLIDDGRHFEMIVCDVMMPEMDGRDFLRELEDRAPAYLDRLIFISGDLFDADLRQFIEERGIPILDKVREIPELRNHL